MKATTNTSRRAQKVHVAGSKKAPRVARRFSETSLRCVFDRSLHFWSLDWCCFFWSYWGSYVACYYCCFV